MNFRAADGDDDIYQDMPRIDWTLPAFPALPRPPPTLPYQNPWDLDYKYPGHYPQPDDHETIDKTQLYNDISFIHHLRIFYIFFSRIYVFFYILACGIHIFHAIFK